LLEFISKGKQQIERENDGVINRFENVLGLISDSFAVMTQEETRLFKRNASLKQDTSTQQQS
jgi:hypothetical protein